MNENAARNILLVRAFETHVDDARWTDADRTWANQAALDANTRDQGVAHFITRRGELGRQRLVERDPKLHDLLQSLRWRWWVGPLIVAVAFGVGLLTDLVGTDKVVNLLAPPILAIVLWNLVVYLLMAGSSLARLLRRGGQSTAVTTGAAYLAGPVNRLIGWLAHGHGKEQNADTSDPQAFQDTRRLPPPEAFSRDWLLSSAPLTARRSAAILHFAAAAVAAGALVAMYFRGLGLEYRAGWESTFLDAGQVTALLGALFVPASWISGIALPDETGFAAMQLSQGDGVNAAQWIHLFALTLLLLVILPRLLLGLFNSVKAIRLRDHFGLDTDSPYFESLARVWRGDAANLLVLPYSYTVSDAHRNALNRLLGQVHGADAAIRVASAAQHGDEDDWTLPATDSAPAIVVLLFAMTATPEAETHGAFARRVSEQIPSASVLLALVDESRFKARFAQQAGRLEQRRRAWQKVLNAQATSPVFVDLAGPSDPQTQRQLIDAINASSHHEPASQTAPSASLPGSANTAL